LSKKKRISWCAGELVGWRQKRREPWALSREQEKSNTKE